MTKHTLPQRVDDDTQLEIPRENNSEVHAAEPETVALERIRRDEQISCRARGINSRIVAEYSAAMQAGSTFPPVVVFRDPKGVHWLADGFHRCGAAELAGLVEIAADVREGGRREALLHGARANSAHGLRRTNADKRRAVELVLKSFPRWSDRKIGEACGVDNKTAARVRGSTEELPHADREGSDGKTRAVPSFDVERELARLEKTIAALLERWPGDDADGRARLRVALDEWGDRTATEPQHTASSKPAKRSPKANSVVVAGSEVA